ncbi:MAG: urease accessory protein UreF [Gloeomargarita sp. SKYG116]|nr:urease accessory protein UreF [Gloeomargarita sp. SKYG116]MDW8401954.1 urease accessory protein UreF [Gloeomargarita sp. SKYGB_i_bin116]
MSGTNLLAILQLASPALPVGAYSYSEGIEWLVERGVIRSATDLEQWLRHELQYGSVQLDARVVRRLYGVMEQADPTALAYWNQWLSAQRDTEELRYQSWQMGNALIKLLKDMDLFPSWLTTPIQPCNYGVAFAITAYQWGISLADSLKIYLFSWTANIISAGIRTIPIGQTEGQKMLFRLHALIQEQSDVLTREAGELESCTIGLGLASMYHETQYSRLFRS